jgi:hypothetical protein
MPFNKATTYGESLNILESEVGLITRTRTATNDMGTVVGTRKIIQAGALYTNPDDASDIGVVLSDYDVTDYDALPIAVVVEGRLYADKVSAAAKAKKAELAAIGVKLV